MTILLPDVVHDWLMKRSLTWEDIESWGGEWHAASTSLWLPTYSLNGTFQFWVVRNFAANQKYLYNPKGSRISMQLYGIHRALPYLIGGYAVTCEGSSDSMALHKAGIKSSVALLGSYMSKTQYALLTTLSRGIILWLDGDSTGITAAQAILKRFTGERFLTLTVQGLDPAEAVTSGTPVGNIHDFVVQHFTEYQQLSFDKLGNLTNAVLRV